MEQQNFYLFTDACFDHFRDIFPSPRHRAGLVQDEVMHMLHSMVSGELIVRLYLIFNTHGLDLVTSTGPVGVSFSLYFWVSHMMHPGIRLFFSIRFEPCSARSP